MKIYNGRDSSDVAYDDKYNRCVAMHVFDGVETTHTFTSLDMTSDGSVYDIVVSGQFTNSSLINQIKMYVNGDTTDANYYSNTTVATPTTLVVQAQSMPYIGGLGGGFGNDTITLTCINGRVGANGNASYNRTAVRSQIIGYSYTVDVTNVTSLQFISETGLAFESGSTIKIYKRGAC